MPAALGHLGTGASQLASRRSTSGGGSTGQAEGTEAARHLSQLRREGQTCAEGLDLDQSDAPAFLIETGAIKEEKLSLEKEAGSCSDRSGRPDALASRAKKETGSRTV